jgi:hypothetical protein
MTLNLDINCPPGAEKCEPFLHHGVCLEGAHTTIGQDDMDETIEAFELRFGPALDDDNHWVTDGHGWPQENLLGALGDALRYWSGDHPKEVPDTVRFVQRFAGYVEGEWRACDESGITKGGVKADKMKPVTWAALVPKEGAEEPAEEQDTSFLTEIEDAASAVEQRGGLDLYVRLMAEVGQISATAHSVQRGELAYANGLADTRWRLVEVAGVAYAWAQTIDDDTRA